MLGQARQSTQLLEVVGRRSRRNVGRHKRQRRRDLRDRVWVGSSTRRIRATSGLSVWLRNSSTQVATRWRVVKAPDWRRSVFLWVAREKGHRLPPTVWGLCGDGAYLITEHGPPVHGGSDEAVSPFNGRDGRSVDVGPLRPSIAFHPQKCWTFRRAGHRMAINVGDQFLPARDHGEYWVGARFPWTPDWAKMVARGGVHGQRRDEATGSGNGGRA
jgi:hypothetical protein